MLSTDSFDFAGLSASGRRCRVITLILAISFYWIIKLRREIQHRVQVQAELEKATQEAYEANEVKSSFLARMSHEIRTPLNAITGMAYLLKKTNLTLTQKMYADRITQASQVMLSIIDDILDYSKIEAGKVELERVSFNIDHLIQDVVNIVLHKVEEQKIGFRFAKEPSVPRWFVGDPKRIKQILLNVLNNAAKFTEEGEISLDIRLLAKEMNCTTSPLPSGHRHRDGSEQLEGLFRPSSRATAVSTGASAVRGWPVHCQEPCRFDGRPTRFSTPGKAKRHHQSVAAHRQGPGKRLQRGTVWRALQGCQSPF